MPTLSTLQCVTNARNLGIPACLLDILNVKGGALCPPGYYIPQAALASPAALKTQLLNDSRADSKAARIFFFGNFADFKDNSEAPVEEKLGYGDVSTVRDGVLDWQFRFRVGGLELSNRLRSFNRAGNWFIFVDSNNQLIGTQTTDVSGNSVIGAIPPIEFYQDVFKVNDGKKTTEYWSKFRFQPKFINEQIAYIQDAGFDILSSIPGLQDVYLSGVAGGTSGVYQITPLAGAAKVNLTALFPTAIASAANWTAANAQTGAAITISSAALGTGANAGTVTLTLATTAPPYPAGISDKVSINLVGPTELATGLIPGYESAAPVLITKN
jgi:hypothetical protein